MSAQNEKEQRIAGRELDAEIAERIFGWTRVTCVGHHPYAMGLKPGGNLKNINHYGDVPNYSTDIAAAWEAVEKLRASGLSFTINAYGQRGEEANPTTWYCWFGDDKNASQIGATAPLAICRAALAVSAPLTEETR